MVNLVKGAGKRVWGAAGLALVLILAIWVLRDLFWEGLRLVTDREALQVQVAGYGVLGPLALAGLNLVHVLIALMPGHAVVFAAGYLYGLVPGFLINHLSITFGSLLSFALARGYGRPLVERLAPAEALDRWDMAARGRGFLFLLTCYMLPLFPSDVMNFVAGLSAMPAWRFLVANLLGRAWITFALTAIGALGIELFQVGIPLWAWLAFLAVSLVIYLAWKYHFRADRRAIEPEG